jgi:hypothetical protein
VTRLLILAVSRIIEEFHWDQPSLLDLEME